MTLRVLSVFGTRPEAIKMAPVVRTLEADPGIESLVCSTGQHREMLDQVMSLFGLKADHALDVMKEDQTPTQVIAAVLEGLDDVFDEEQPDWVLVQGDTSTVAAGALAAFYRQIEVGHVEAGLRTRDKWNPFPEEINRRVAGVVADRHFAPTLSARNNLLTEGTDPTSVVVTGNTVIDALQWVAGQEVPSEASRILAEAGAEDADHILLVTAHRRENHGEPLEQICDALSNLATTSGHDLRIIYPVHMNPNVWEPVHQRLEDVENITLVPPVDYDVLVHLMNLSDLVLTDSGGIQEEAPALGKPVLVLRDETERPEGIEAGTVRLVGTDTERIQREVRMLLDDEQAYGEMAKASNPYGDGAAAQRICSSLAGRQVEEFSP